jgi:hypothetical protein
MILEYSTYVQLLAFPKPVHICLVMFVAMTVLDLCFVGHRWAGTAIRVVQRLLQLNYVAFSHFCSDCSAQKASESCAS